MTKIATETGATYITLQWAKSQDTQLPVIGYQIWMDDGDVGDFTIVYDGLNYPNVLKHMVTGLITGREYQFKLSALNFNGPSLPSNPAAFTICASPSLLDPPRMTVYT